MRNVVFVVSEPGKHIVEVRRWSEVLAIARDSGWRAAATQHIYDEDGNEIEAVEVQPNQIEDDFNERAR